MPLTDGTGRIAYALEHISHGKLGYADKGTGNDRINDRIAAKRAAAVVWMLEKRYGIPAERIIEESKGSRVQPFAENDKNRVSIMIAK